MFHIYSGGFTPRALSGCVLWVRADMGITLNAGNVAAWADQSGNANHLLQAVAANQPLYEAAGFGGRPSVRSDGVNDLLQTAAFTLNQPTTIVWAGCELTQVNSSRLWDGGALNTMALFDDGAGHWSQWAGAGGAFVARDANPNILSSVYNGASSLIRKNGTAGTGGNPGAGNAGGLTIFGQAGGIVATQQRVAEVALFNRALSAGEMTQVEHYMGARYGITVA